MRPFAAIPSISIAIKRRQEPLRAARYHSYGPPSVLIVDEAPEPHAAAHSVRIRVLATSVNPIDVLLRSGQFAQVMPLPLPAIPGRDAVGAVDEIGDGVTDTRIGDVVFGLGGLSDTTAEFAVLTAWSAVPAAWTMAQAAAAGLASVTAAAAIDALGNLDGRTLLIEGASGAVGSAAASIASAGGAIVIGTGRADRHQHLRSIGVLPTTYGPGLADRVSALAPDGIHAALHAAPSRSLRELVEIVGDGSRVVTVIDEEGAASLGLRKIDGRNDSTLLRRAASLGERGVFSPRVDHEIAFDDIARAHELAENGAGKIVVVRA